MFWCMANPRNLCVLTIGVNETGPFLKLKSGRQESITIDLEVVERVWRDMCRQLGKPYIRPDWDSVVDR